MCLKSSILVSIVIASQIIRRNVSSFKINATNNSANSTDIEPTHSDSPLENIHQDVISLLDVEGPVSNHIEYLKTRIKRQAELGGGKYVTAAKMGQMRCLHMFLQMVKNLFTRQYVGAQHPMFIEAPKIYGTLIKTRVIDPLSPNVHFIPKSQQEDKK